MKKIVYTNHARIRMAERKLTENIIEKTVFNPDKTLPGAANKILVQKNINGETLEVVYPDFLLAKSIFQ
ncbi:hypothetical protein A2282_03130 [candidate division WOR-1 bacterium RIFOXYA12_FULL_36_13]|nr:MAG: hypothetical protein A2282_03130 [candidate division WOR-1 bacterium RIFOXYA12_FULL_36_13]